MSSGSKTDHTHSGEGSGRLSLNRLEVIHQDTNRRGVRQRAPSEIMGSYPRKAAEDPRKGRHAQGKEKVKEPSTTLGRKHGASFLALLTKILLTTFCSLVGTFIGASLRLPVWYVKASSNRLLCGCFSAWGTAAS